MLSPHSTTEEIVFTPETAYGGGEYCAFSHRAGTEFSLPVPADDAAAVFGMGAVAGTIVSSAYRPDYREIFRHSSVIDAVVLGLFFFFCFMVYKYRDFFLGVMKGVFISRQIQALVEEQSVSFRYFLHVTDLMGTGALAALSTWLFGLWSQAPVFDSLPASFRRWVVSPIFGVFAVIFLYRIVLIRIIAKISAKSDLTGKIFAFDRIIFSAYSFILTILALAVSLSDPTDARKLSLVVGILLILLILYYIFKSFNFFVHRKISILQWILFLCAVEIWPISFFVLFVIRDFKL